MLGIVALKGVYVAGEKVREMKMMKACYVLNEETDIIVRKGSHGVTAKMTKVQVIMTW